MLETRSRARRSWFTSASKGRNLASTGRHQHLCAQLAALYAASKPKKYRWEQLARSHASWSSWRWCAAAMLATWLRARSSRRTSAAGSKAR